MNNYNKYNATTLKTGNTAQKLIFIFDEIIKLLHQTVKCKETGDIEGEYNKLDKIIQVLHPLRYSIDFEKGGEAAKYFDRFCYSTIDKLQQINIKNEDSKEISNVIEAVKIVRDTLTEAGQKEGML